MSALTKIAIVGATGNLGPAILQQVVNARFDVTVLTRKSSSHTFPASVKVVEVDYESLDSVTDALRGQDAVVSTIGSAALSKQLLLVEAAAKAGVKRFLPSEFGSDTVHPKVSKLPSFGDKIAVQEALKSEAARAGGMTYTLVITGPFLDWGMRVGFLANVKARKITTWDGGNEVFSSTTLESIGRAVAGVLRHPAETENRAVYVQDTALAPTQLLEIAKRVVGSEGWEVTDNSLSDHVAKAWEELAKPNPNPANWAFNFIIQSIAGEGYGAKFEKLDNELLGVKEFSEADIEALIRRLAAE
ncbi:NAD(P)-binding protein [Nemania sp. NC0429]|nr:NAD(P)-binding protein [Nemania sp. NC0429]